MDKRSNAENHTLCHFSYADGRRCRMLRHRDHPGLCPFHSREERQRLESERIGTELAASLSGNYLTASDINHVLGKVFTALAQDRISVKKAKALAYVAQLMLHSLRWAKSETQIRYSYDSWQHMLQNATKLPDPLPATSHDFADAVFATAEARAASPWERQSPIGAGGAAADAVGAGFSPPSVAANPRATSELSARRGDFTSPSENVAARPPHSREAVTARPESTKGPGHSGSGAAGAQPLGVGASAPTYKTAQSAHLSSPLYPDAGRAPSAPSADACGDSSHRATSNGTNEYTDEDNTEEPALVFADHRPFLHLR